MSRFTKAAARMATSEFKHLGDECTYTPKNTGMPIKTLAIIHRDVDVTGGFDSVVTLTETHIVVPKADVNVAKKGDKIAVAGERFTVEDYAPSGNTGQMLRLIVK